MFRMTRMMDYGSAIIACLVAHYPHKKTAREIAAEINLPLATVSKLLKKCQAGGILISHRGSRGGYGLTCDPSHIPLGKLIHTLEARSGMTLCSDKGEMFQCELSPRCQVKHQWQSINAKIMGWLGEISLWEFTMGASIPPLTHVSGRQRGKLS